MIDCAFGGCVVRNERRQTCSSIDRDSVAGTVQLLRFLFFQSNEDLRWRKARYVRRSRQDGVLHSFDQRGESIRVGHSWGLMGAIWLISGGQGGGRSHRLGAFARRGTELIGFRGQDLPGVELSWSAANRAAAWALDCLQRRSYGRRGSSLLPSQLSSNFF